MPLCRLWTQLFNGETPEFQNASVGTRRFDNRDRADWLQPEGQRAGAATRQRGHLRPDRRMIPVTYHHFEEFIMSKRFWLLAVVPAVLVAGVAIA